jgi:hypothetical protein
VIGDTITAARRKLARARLVGRAQNALDGNLGQEVVAKCFGRRMDELLRARMKRVAEAALQREGIGGVTVEVVFHLDRKLVELKAHAEDAR